MGSALEVTDSLSNTEEQIERAARTIGHSKVRRAVFAAIYHHKAPVKTVEEISQRIGFSRMRVLQAGGYFARRQIVQQTKKDGDTAYRKIDFFHAHKPQILRLAGNPKKLARLPTKRKVMVTLPRTVALPGAGAKASRITIDDIDSFSKVRKIKFAGSLTNSLSETHFKNGVQVFSVNRENSKTGG